MARIENWNISLPVNDGVMVEWNSGKTYTNKRGQVIIEKTSKEFYEKDRAKAELFLNELRKNGHPEAEMYDCLF